MSLEQALAENTAALIANTAARQGIAIQAAQAATEKPSKTKPATAKADASTVGAPAVTMKQVADAGVALANSYSRDEAVAILTKYKVSKFSELKADQLAGALEDINATTARLKAAADALATAPKPNDSLV